MSETNAHDIKTTVPKVEVSREQLDEILLPNQTLAKRYLDRCIEQAEKDPEPDAEALDLLRFQRSMVDMRPDEVLTAAEKFATDKGKYASFLGPHLPPDLHAPVIRARFVPTFANEERWRILGVDPTQFEEESYARGYRGFIEEDWRIAREARANLEAAQLAEVKAIQTALNPSQPVLRSN
jgi:hypothetical protein